jgi:hypothetical protein
LGEGGGYSHYVRNNFSLDNLIIEFLVKYAQMA